MRGFVSGLRVCVVMQISMRIQIIVGIWVLMSMMYFMPGKGEQETGIFCHFYGKSGASWWFRCMSTRCHTSLLTNLKWWNRDYSVYTEVHVFFLIKAFGRNIEIE